MKTTSTTFNWVKQNIILFAFIALFLVFSFLAPSFTRVDNLINITRQISFIGIASVGIMFVLLTGGIDLSIGSLVQVVNVIGAKLMVEAKVSPIWAVLIVVALSIVSGLLNGLMITKLQIPPIIATMAMMNILNGIAFLISGGQPTFGFPESFAVLGQGYVGVIPVPTIVMMIMFICGAFVLKKTTFGRSLYAIGGNEEATRLSGINVTLTKLLAYVCSSLFACLAGVLMLSRLFSGTANTGKGFEFQVITAVVLGGVSVNGGAGRLFSVIFGVFIIGILNNGLILINVNTYWQYVINGAVLVIAVGADYYSRRKGESVARIEEAEKVAIEE